MELSGEIVEMVTGVTCEVGREGVGPEGDTAGKTFASRGRGEGSEETGWGNEEGGRGRVGGWAGGG